LPQRQKEREESGVKLREWLSKQVGDTPAWAIVVAAALTAIGAAVGGVFVSGGASLFHSVTQSGGLFISASREGTTEPLDDVSIEILAFPDANPISLTSDGKTSLTTHGGMASTTKLIPAGSYNLKAEYTDNGVKYGRIESIEINGKFSKTIEFNPDKWFRSKSSILEPSPQTLPASEIKIDGKTPWMAIAKNEIGQTEVVGEASNPRIIEYIQSTGNTNFSKEGDELPWTGAFANWAMKKSGYSGPPNPLSAYSWLSWGRPTELTPGCLAVFWRSSPASGLGHVGFYIGQDNEALHIIGGNQNNSVSIARVSKARLLSCRLPA
jgi:uncharacterized protein (TIGR02594 family)